MHQKTKDKKGHLAHLGGLFLYSNTPQELALWYEKVFGLQYAYEDPDKLHCISLNYEALDGKRYQVFSINKSAIPLERLPHKYFTLNLRVTNMAEMLIHLKEINIKFKGPEKHDEGSFAWIKDPDGNHLELWEDV